MDTVRLAHSPRLRPLAGARAASTRVLDAVVDPILNRPVARPAIVGPIELII